MNKFIIAAIAAATILPAAANAQSFDRHGPGRPGDTRVVVVDRSPKPVPAAWHRPAPVARIAIGTRVEPGFVASHAVVKNPARYRLARAGANARWVKVRDDAVLVNLRTNRVINIAYNLFR